MKLHEVIYKIIGSDGVVLLLSEADEAKRAASSVSNTLQEIRVMSAGESMPKEQEAIAVVCDPSELDDRLVGSYPAVKNALCLLKSIDNAVRQELISVFSSCGFYVEAIAPLDDFEGCQVCVFLRRHDATAEDDGVARLFVDLAFFEYLDSLKETRSARELTAKLDALGEEYKDLLRRNKKSEADIKVQSDARAKLEERVLETVQKAKEEREGRERVELQLEQTNVRLNERVSQIKQIRESFSFRIGHALALSVRSPKGFLLLPYRIARITVGTLKRRIRRNPRGRLSARNSSDSTRSMSARKPASGEASSENSWSEQVLSDLMLPDRKPAKDGRLGAILHPAVRDMVTDPQFREDLHPNTWRAQVERSSVDEIMVDCYGLLDATPWAGTVSGGAFGYARHLIRLLQDCRREERKLTLLVDCRDDQIEYLADIVGFFDRILVTSYLDPSRLRPFVAQGVAVEVIHLPISRALSVPAMNEMLELYDEQVDVMGGMLVKEGASGSEMLVPSHEAIEPAHVFGRILPITRKNISDLRIIEAIAAGAIPCGEADELRKLQGFFGFVGMRSGDGPSQKPTTIEEKQALAGRNWLMGAARFSAENMPAILSGLSSRRTLAEDHMRDDVVCTFIAATNGEVERIENLVSVQTRTVRTVVICEEDIIRSRQKTTASEAGGLEFVCLPQNGDKRYFSNWLSEWMKTQNAQWVCLLPASAHIGGDFYAALGAVSQAGLDHICPVGWQAGEGQAIGLFAPKDDLESMLRKELLRLDDGSLLISLDGLPDDKRSAGIARGFCQALSGMVE